MSRFAFAFWFAGYLLTLNVAHGAEEPSNKPRMVAIDLIVAEFTAAKAESGTSVGSIKFEMVENATERLKQLESTGAVGSVARFHVTSLEQNEARVQFGERMPVVVGRTRSAVGGRDERGGVGPTSSSFAVQEFGTIVVVMPKVELDGAVVLALEVERSRHIPPSTARDTAPNDSLSKTSTLSSKCTVRIPHGKMVLLSGAKVRDQEGESEVLIMISARVDDAG